MIHVNYIKRLHSQKLVGETNEAHPETNEQTGQIKKNESALRKQSLQDEEYDDLVNDFSDLPTIPLTRSGRQIRQPAWHADYEM